MAPELKAAVRAVVRVEREGPVRMWRRQGWRLEFEGVSCAVGRRVGMRSGGRGVRVKQRVEWWDLRRWDREAGGGGGGVGGDGGVVWW